MKKHAKFQCDYTYSWEGYEATDKKSPVQNVCSPFVRRLIGDKPYRINIRASTAKFQGSVPVTRFNWCQVEYAGNPSATLIDLEHIRLLDRLGITDGKKFYMKIVPVAKEKT